ncbi:MAG: ATP pyrophosphatase, partial [Candidatus Hecatellales archaeon]
GEVGIKAFEPLWNEAYEKLIGEFLDSGFQALVVSARADLIGEEWVGKPYDQKFVKYLKERNLDLCGEKGEFHTLVTYGPIFKRHIRILEAVKKVREEHCFLEILRFSLV